MVIHNSTYHGKSTAKFLKSLSQGFLLIGLVVSLSMVILLMDTPVAFTSEPSAASLTITGHHHQLHQHDHQWALARFGFPSAFHDGLYPPLLTDMPCQPSRLHLSQASNVDAAGLVNMTLSFTVPRNELDTPHHDCQDIQVTILYGQGLFADGSSSEGQVLQFHYNASLAVPELTNYQSDWIHHMVIPRLQAGRQMYWYRLIVQGKNVEENTKTFLRGTMSQLLGSTRTYTFMTPPVANQPTSLALVGDLGQTENSTKTMHRIYEATKSDASIPVSGLVIAGDLSYADGDPRRWTSWMELMEPLLRSTPLYSVPGNHEIECDASTHEVFRQYESYFRNPNRLGDAKIQPIPDDYRKTLWSCLTSSQFLGHYNFGNAFWSVNHGLVHIIGLNSYTSTLPGSPQYQWINQELQQIDRSVTPWILVVFHCPLHTTFLGHNGEVNSLLMFQTMEPLFVEYQVNIVVSGHDHAYMRTEPMKGMEINDKGPIYLTLGAGGNREQHSKGYIHPDPEEWVVKRDIWEYGFGHLQIPNATHAYLTWVRDGTTTEGIRDSVWLQNHYFT